MAQKGTYFYALHLENNKFYVGLTEDPVGRLKKHFNKGGSEWTKLHPPLQLLELFLAKSKNTEKLLTFYYMHKYGIENVRGGPYCQRILSTEQVTYIKENLEIQFNTYNSLQKKHNTICNEILTSYRTRKPLHIPTKTLDLNKYSFLDD